MINTGAPLPVTANIPAPAEPPEEWDLGAEPDEKLAAYQRDRPWLIPPGHAQAEADRAHEWDKLFEAFSAMDAVAAMDDAQLRAILTRRICAEPMSDVMATPAVVEAKRKLVAELIADRERKRLLDPFHPVTAERLLRPLRRQLEDPATPSADLIAIQARCAEIEASARGERGESKHRLRLRIGREYRRNVLPAARAYGMAGLEATRPHLREALVLEAALRRFHGMGDDVRLRFAVRVARVRAHFDWVITSARKQEHVCPHIAGAHGKGSASARQKGAAAGMFDGQHGYPAGEGGSNRSEADGRGAFRQCPREHRRESRCGILDDFGLGIRGA